MSHCSDTDSAADIKPPKPVQTPDRTRRALTLNVQNPSTKVPKSQSPQRYKFKIDIKIQYSDIFLISSSRGQIPV